jgi:hypothetical protein
LADIISSFDVRQRMQVAFRVQTNAAILGAGIVLADGADTYPAPSATSHHHPKLTAFFAPQTRNATCGSPPWRNAMEFLVLVDRCVWVAGGGPGHIILKKFFFVFFCDFRS